MIVISSTRLFIKLVAVLFVFSNTLAYSLRRISNNARINTYGIDFHLKPQRNHYEKRFRSLHAKPFSNLAEDENVRFEVHSSIGSISAKSWDKCLENDDNASPFLEHAWLRCLEESRCVSPESGWVPQHISIRIDGRICGFVPLYIKAHSMGEFIFDSAWADAAHANGLNYYPKLLVGIPFTPVTGQRILLHPSIRRMYSPEQISRLRRMVASFLKEAVQSNNISSVHINFLTDEEATDIAGELKYTTSKARDGSLPDKLQAVMKRLKSGDKDDYMRRTSLQYHWTNSNSRDEGKPYKSFDDFLACFSSKRRISIKRERRKVTEDEDIIIDAVMGKNILDHEGLVERMFDVYLSTVDKMMWGRQYLTLDFFRLLVSSEFIDNLCFLCARRRSSGECLKANDVFAGTFNVVKRGVFYGRYWGCLSEVKNLHFETCYWSSIEFCINNGLKRMEPGAGGAGKRA